MLKIYYESGNDYVAIAQRNIKSKVIEAIFEFEKFGSSIITVSQRDVINQIGVCIYEDLIDHDKVIIIIEELNKQFTFNREGILNGYWFDLGENY